MIEKRKQVFVCQLFRFVCSFLVLLSVEARHLSQIISLVTIVLTDRESTSTLVCITPLGRGVIHYMNFFNNFSLIFLRALIKDHPKRRSIWCCIPRFRTPVCILSVFVTSAVDLQTRSLLSKASFYSGIKEGRWQKNLACKKKR